MSRVLPTSTVSSSATEISVNVPATGDGISVSTLSVLTQGVVRRRRQRLHRLQPTGDWCPQTLSPSVGSVTAVCSPPGAAAAAAGAGAAAAVAAGAGAAGLVSAREQVRPEPVLVSQVLVRCRGRGRRGGWSRSAGADALRTLHRRPQARRRPPANIVLNGFDFQQYTSSR